MHAFFHLFNSSVFLSVLVAAVLSVPILFIEPDDLKVAWIFNFGNIFLAGFMSIAIFYWVATQQTNKNPARKFFSLFPRFLIVSMGLSLHNGLAVLEGLLGIKSPFVRTPKFNILRKGDSWKSNVYIQTRLNAVTLLEGILCLYFVFGIIMGIYLGNTILLVFHSMLAIGFGYVFYYSVKPLRNA